MKIAIASSGLDHVRRGVEAWAEDTARALVQGGVDVTLFRASDSTSEGFGVVVPCLRRTASLAVAWMKRLERIGSWRVGLSNTYDIEQTTFAWNLFPFIRKEFDILHVQDPRLARIFVVLHKLGLSRPRVILGHGTEESVAELQKLPNLQHLAPTYLKEWERHRPVKQLVFAIPNFVNTGRFHPSDKGVARRRLDLPESAFVILSVGALKHSHKRMDYVLNEFERYLHGGGNAFLVIAGAKESETPEILALSMKLPPGTIRLEADITRDKVLQYMQSADVFTLASRHEMLPIAMLEALSCGLPVICNDTPTFRYIVGTGGSVRDLMQPGSLSAEFARYEDIELRAEKSKAARLQAEATFSESVVISQIVAMYRKVCDRP